MMEFSNHGLVKSEIESDGGLVVAKHPLAAQAGASILRQGGNAVDAAIATAFVIGVVEPYMSGVGGVGIGMWWDGRQVHQIDGYTRVPQGLDPAFFPLTDGVDSGLFGWPHVVGDRNIHGPWSVAVPSVPAMLEWLHQQGGSLPWGQLLEPAIRLAREGWDVDWLTVLNIVESQDLLSRYPSSAAVFLPGGRVPAADLNEQGGQRIIQRDLASTLETLASEGAHSFYRGRIAEQIADFMAKTGGFLTAEDLSDYRVRTAQPLALEIGGSTVWLPSGLNGGPTLAEILHLMTLSDWRSESWGSPDLLCDWILSGLTAFSDRFEHLGCHVEPPPLWTREYAAARKQELPRSSAFPRSSDSTTHLAVVDSNGQGVALTLTLLSRWGSHVVVPHTGVLLNNGLMWCDPRPGRANSLAPGAVPLANMAPALVTHAAHLRGLVGSSGGRRIIGANAQILFNLLVHGMSPQAAVSAPRVDFSGWPVIADARIPSEVLKQVSERLSVPVNPVRARLGGSTFASPVIIWGEPGRWKSGLDPMVDAAGEAVPASL